MKVFTVGELREAIQPFTDECAIISGLDIEYQLSCGDGRLLVCAANHVKSGRPAPNSAMDAIASLSRRYIDSHTDVPNWVIHDFVEWCRQQHQ